MRVHPKVKQRIKDIANFLFVLFCTAIVILIVLATMSRPPSLLVKWVGL